MPSVTKKMRDFGIIRRMPSEVKTPFEIYSLAGKAVYSQSSLLKTFTSKKSYYVSPSGSDSSAGTEAAPFATINKAIGMADVDEVVLLAGVYNRNNGAITCSKDIRIVAKRGHRVIVGSHSEPLTWTATATPGVYTTTRSTTWDVVDMTLLDEHGDFTFYENKSTTAEVDATPGSWNLNGSLLTVHTFDNRAPDANIAVSFSVTNQNIEISTAAKVYLEGIEFSFSRGLYARTVGVAVGATFYAKNCTFSYVSSDGTSASGNGIRCWGFDVAVFENCVAKRNAYDGFNYHQNTSDSYSGFVLESNCVGRDNGRIAGADNNQGSTAHDNIHIVRIGCTFERNDGGNIADIDNTVSVNIALYGASSRSATAATNCNFYGSTNTMFLMDCYSIGSTYDAYHSGVGYTYIDGCDFNAQISSNVIAAAL